MQFSHCGFKFILSKEIPQFKLYKYIGKSEYYMDEIKSKHVFVNNPKNFNDPFDCAVERILEGKPEHKSSCDDA